MLGIPRACSRGVARSAGQQDEAQPERDVQGPEHREDHERPHERRGSGPCAPGCRRTGTPKMRSTIIASAASWRVIEEVRQVAPDHRRVVVRACRSAPLGDRNELSLGEAHLEDEHERVVAGTAAASERRRGMSSEPSVRRVRRSRCRTSGVERRDRSRPGRPGQSPSTAESAVRRGGGPGPVYCPMLLRRSSPATPWRWRCRPPSRLVLKLRLDLVEGRVVVAVVGLEPVGHLVDVVRARGSLRSARSTARARSARRWGTGRPGPAAS